MAKQTWLSFDKIVAELCCHINIIKHTHTNTHAYTHTRSYIDKL